jgi:hypothetical protein
MLFRLLQNDTLMQRVFGFPKMYSLVLLRLAIMPRSFMLIFQMRGLLPFSGALRMIMCLSSSRSIHFSFVASPDRTAVSFRSCRKAESFFREPAIKASNSSSLGMKGSLRLKLVLGFSHFMPYLFA